MKSSPKTKIVTKHSCNKKKNGNLKSQKKPLSCFFSHCSLPIARIRLGDLVLQRRNRVNSLLDEFYVLKYVSWPTAE